MTLSESQKKFLRGLGHTLKPVIMVGEAGLTDKLHAEFESTIAHHELIKIRVRVGDRGARDIIVNELCTRNSAELVQRIGNMALLYRQNPDQTKIRVPGK